MFVYFQRFGEFFELILGSEDLRKKCVAGQRRQRGNFHPRPKMRNQIPVVAYIQVCHFLKWQRKLEAAELIFHFLSSRIRGCVTAALKASMRNIRAVASKATTSEAEQSYG